MNPLKNQTSPEFERLLEAHRPRLHAFLLSLTGSGAAADDLAQETCLVLWEKREQFDPSGDFRAWAFRVAFLQAQNHRRRVARRKNRELPGDELFDRIADVAIERHGRDEFEERRHNALLGCLRKLREPHRDLLLSRYQDGTSLEHLSNEAGLNRNAMAQKLFRIKTTVARCVRRKLGDGA
ncbi:MAG: sigma-70 family RNA polymerase sigma factor [Verrucomicrobiae bacterium]|nr:sigma-70 family RNA polymerase sigma factor [Verrucomicrobiae bacterium]